MASPEFYTDKVNIPKVAMEFPFREMFPTPLEVLCFYDEDIRSGKFVVHDWQREMLLYMGQPRPNGEKIRAMLLAANGSGKSQYVLAPFAVWMSLVFKESLTVITTASGDQLDTQACRYINRLCNNANQIHLPQFGFDIFKCIYREVRNNITRSFIDLFATDEKKKAEGRHPLRGDSEFAIIIDEAKTVDDGIYEALERCKGNTRRIEISSADDCRGYFFNTWGNENYKCFRKKVTAFDCPHITKDEINETIVKYGQDSPFVRASIYSEFVSVQEDAVISRDLLTRSIRLASCPTYFGPLCAGLDLSAGGDETVLSVWNGNVEVGMHTLRNPDTTKTREDIIGIIRDVYKGKLLPENIWADDGGVGRSIIDQLNERGYKLRRVLNNHRAFDFTHYANRGTELWFNFKRFIEEYQVMFMMDSNSRMDETLFSQLCHRYSKLTPTKLLKLESKAEARKQGHPSPDRADAVVLAWCGRVYPLPEITGVKPAKVVESPGDTITRLEQEIRAKLREGFMDRANKPAEAHEKYKQLGNIAFAHSNLHPSNGGQSTILNRYAKSTGKYRGN
jgi:phage terminase large subunit